MIRNDFSRKKWKFGWSFGDFLLIFAILFGLTEGLAENYVEDLEVKFSEPIGDIGEVISEERIRQIEESEKAEEKFLRKNNGDK